MHEKVCIVTGASRGIGRETALGLAERGARVLMVANDPLRLAEACDQIRSHSRASAETYPADLSRMAEVRALATKIRLRHPRIDVLVNNHARIYPNRQITDEHIEATFAVDYLSYYLLTRLLLDVLAAGGRIVNVCAEAHRAARIDFDDLQNEAAYNGANAYNRAKLAVLLFSHELARQTLSSRLTVNCLHPGIVDTDARREYRAAVLASGGSLSGREPVDARMGAECSIYLATAPEVSGVSGKYFLGCQQIEPSKEAQDSAAARCLWAISASLTGFEDTIK